MNWQEIRDRYPHQWLLVEAVTAHDDGQRRVLDTLLVVERAEDGVAAMERQARLQRELPGREIYFLHTDRESAEVLTRVEPMHRGLRWS